MAENSMPYVSNLVIESRKFEKFIFEFGLNIFEVRDYFQSLDPFDIINITPNILIRQYFLNLIINMTSKVKFDGSNVYFDARIKS